MEIDVNAFREEYGPGLGADMYGDTGMPYDVAAIAEQRSDAPDPVPAAPNVRAASGAVRRPVSVQRVNRLGGEVSPYLLQHAANPVGWYPWGPEPFEAAKAEDKPVFLSIGYSSCHWCHVMERECFSDPEAAELINDACIPVKVDREERPDIDELFMEVCRMQNGSGGWPLNLFLTPDGLPFFSTTWLPKRTSGQMPGITDIMPRMKWLWLMQRDAVIRAANELAKMMKARSQFLSGGKIGGAARRSAMVELRRKFDMRWGGFGGAPKFPDAPKLLFLLDQSTNLSNTSVEREDAFTMTDITLRRMWRGGIHDHLGGGFARYSTDERWVVPHFEKLLPDQAMLLLTAAAANEIKPDPFYRMMANDIVKCVKGSFLAPSDAFYSAIDSDNSDGEGGYYVWTDDEIHSLLPEGDAGLFCAAYAVMPGGNFGHEMAGSQISCNILYEASSVTELARRYGLRGPDVAQRLANDREILLKARSMRRAPPRDEKILMDWNGLMIGALARASSSFGEPEWRLMAERAAMYLQKTLPDPKGSLRRRIMGDKAGIPAMACDYAAMLWGVMEIHAAASKADAGEKQLGDWLKYASVLAEAMRENFWDEKKGGLFLSPADDDLLFLRRKAADDDPLPSANALALRGLTMLAAALGEPKYADMGKKIIACFANEASITPLRCISLVTAAAMWQPVSPKLIPKPEPSETIGQTAAEEPQEEVAPMQETPRSTADRPRRVRPGARQRPHTQAHDLEEQAAEAAQERSDRRDRASARRDRRAARAARKR